MLLSNSVLHRYTPPTCTLQLVARSSPLSRWMGQSVTTPLQFDLRFDDPRLLEEQRVSIQGDRDQLEALHEAVTTYIQDLLNQSPDRFNTILSALALSPDAADGWQAQPSPPSSQTTVLRTIDLSADDSQALSEEPRSLYLSHHSHPDLELVGEDARPTDPTARPGEKILLQPGTGLSHNLFLGSLATEETGPIIQLSVLQLFDLANALDEYAVDVLALPTQIRPRAAGAPPAWTRIAAMLVVVVGLTTVVIQLFNRPDSQQQTANQSATPGLSSNDQQSIASQPSPTLGVPTPLLSSPETLPSLPLPPPGSIVPSPLQTVTVPRTTARPLPSNPTVNAPVQAPVNPIPRGRRQDTSVYIPGEATSPRTSGARTLRSAVPPSPAATPSPSFQLSSPNSDLEAALSEANPIPAPPAESNNTPTAQRSRASINEPRSTAFDSNPQVEEAREYFEQRWQPPANLTDPLEYTLLLGVDGTIQRIVPVGKAARDYVDRSGMPLVGESFVSPNKSGQTSIIRVRLNPDGKVQTFLLESSK